ncbi:hypothetical protein NGG03_16825 [Klebsiella michiganensis]|uniref:hypothetical protein n=1 Tax=Klebsiella michiganensis TaxID=1134687 RepID=UPI002DBF6E62|nr:hypothetical protein [Klebsiella michiganensis]MEB8291575.1 hypothetical protein [Klebsiella michiganensis]
MTITLQAVNELIQSLESAGELSIKETKVMALARAYQQLAAENVALKQSKPSLKTMMSALDTFYAHEDVPESAMLIAFNILRGDVETPATDRIVAGIKAEGSASLVSALKVIANSEQHNGDTVVCDFDTLISVAACALRDYYAKPQRQEADK